MKRNHWIGVGIIIFILLWGIFDPQGIGHAVTGIFQGIDSVATSFKNGKA